VLPVIVVSIQIIAVYSRYMRASLLEVKNSDYLPHRSSQRHQ
jgi:ABC-type dipeptide/oligopeptide/nickel transport system permease component